MSLLLLAKPDFVTLSSLVDDFGRLKTVFLKEVIYNPLEQDATTVDRALSFFRSRQMVVTDSQQGISVRNPLPLACYAGLFHDIVLTYKWVLERGTEVDSGRASHRAMARQLMKLSQEKQETNARLSPPVFVVTVGNAAARFGELGILSPKDWDEVPAPQENGLSREATLELLDRVASVGGD